MAAPGNIMNRCLPVWIGMLLASSGLLTAVDAEPQPGSGFGFAPPDRIEPGEQIRPSDQRISAAENVRRVGLRQPPLETTAVAAGHPGFDTMTRGVDLAQQLPRENVRPSIPLPASVVPQETPPKYVWRPVRPVSELIPGFHLGRWEGRVEAYLDHSRIDTENPAVRQRNDNRLYEARFTVRNRGAYIVDPRLARFTLGGTVGIARQELDFTSDGTDFDDSRDTDLSGYEFLADILPLNSFSAIVFANRNRSTQSGGLAGSSRSDVSNAGVTVSARRLYIPSTLSMRVDRSETAFGREALASSRRDERRYSITYDGRRGWLNRALRVRYAFVDKDERFFPSTNFSSHDASAFYSLDFGPGLNRRWDTRIRINDRTGIRDETRLNIDQLLNIDHSDRLRTRYRYLSTFTDRPVGDNDKQTIAFLLDHRLYESLETTLELSDATENFPGGGRDVRRGRLNLDYKKRLPNDARVFANLTVFKERQDDEFETTRAFVFEEEHRFDETFALPIGLNQPLVEPGSVSIVKTENGPEVTGCGDFSVPRPLVEGVDYTLRNIGDVTEVVPLPCTLTSAGINPDDLIRVDYVVLVDPSRKIETDGYAFDLSIGYRNFRPFYRREETNQDLLSGGDNEFLNDRELEAFGVDMHYDTESVRGRLLVEHEQSESRDQDKETIRAIASLRYDFRPRWQLSLNGRLSETEFTRPRDRVSELQAVRALLTYVRHANLRVEFFAEVRDLNDTLIPDEHREELGARVRWRYGKLDIVPTVQFIDLRRGETDLQDYRTTLRVIRRF